MRICTKCGESKPLSEYYLRKNKKPYGECKVCYCLARKAWKKRQGETYKAHQRAYMASKSEENKKKYRDNPEPKKAYARKYYAKNKEKCKARCKQYRQSPKGRAVDYAKHLKRKTIAPMKPHVAKYMKLNCPPDYHIEHCVPRSRGGDNSLENLCWLPAEINLRKNAKTIDEFGIAEYYRHAIFPDPQEVARYAGS